jgi:hypothetical protein
MAGLYGRIEHGYCEPFAEAFAISEEFRDWILAKFGLLDWVGRSTSLKSEQQATRTARFWWKNYFCHESRCTCPSLAGREVDILLFCRHDEGAVLAVHVECKHPKDKFSKGQAEGYRNRAACWASGRGGPRSLLPHNQAKTLLICDRVALSALDLTAYFDNIIHFDEISKRVTPYPAIS